MKYMIEDLSYIDCKDLLESTGIRNISESGGEISFSCPGPDHFHGDTSPSARMNSRTSAWICHGCSMRGNAITFLAWHKSLPETVARRLLEERYGGGSISLGVENLEDMVNKIMNPEIIKEEKRISPDESWLDKFKVDWRNKNWCQGCSPIAETNYELKYTSPCCGCTEPPGYKKYMYERDFTSDILEKWQIGYDEISDRITIPIKDHEGKLVGFKGRAWRDNTIPKYMILGDNRNQNRYGFQPYQKSHYVFGLDKILKNRGEHYYLNINITEGELNVIAMDQHEFDAVGIAGSEFSQIQCNLIKDYFASATLFLDNDKAGDKGTKKVIEMLCPYMPLKIIQNAPGDAAELSRSDIENLVSNVKSALELQVEGNL